MTWAERHHFHVDGSNAGRVDGKCRLCYEWKGPLIACLYIVLVPTFTAISSLLRAGTSGAGGSRLGQLAALQKYLRFGPQEP